MKKIAIGILSLSVFLAACEDPAANKTKATTTNSATNSATNTATNAAAPTKPATKGEAIPVTAENSKVEFTGSKVTGKHDGGFKTFTGTIDLVNGKPEESSVFVDIDMNSVFTDADGLTEHLKGADFFDVAKYPKASFYSRGIVRGADQGNYTVTGDFVLHGQTKQISFPAKISVTDTDVAVDSEFSINRKDFGIVYAGKTDDLIRDDVVIRLNLKGQRKK